MQPLVSIIVSCYNAEKYVAETLESLLGQTYRNIEIIVVNDGSTDDSEAIIQGFADSRIKYYKQANKGQCSALNKGFSLSTGDYVKFYDADDILTKEVIASQVKTLNGRTSDCISFIEWRRFYNDLLPTSVDVNDLHTIHRDCTPLEYITWLEKPPMVQCGLWLLPRTLIIKSGLWDERLSLINDTEFFTRIFTHTRLLKFCDSGYTFYRTNMHVSSLSKDISRKGIKSAILSIDLAAKSMLAIENSERIKRLIVKGYVMILEWAFPKHKMYVRLVERRLQQYPQQYIAFTRSSKAYNVIMKLFGWKAANRLSKYYRKTRYSLD